ncbi:MAG: phenylalanine--tRNA ligase subunit beta, partial [Candidatus Latescibacterota bacterium]
MLKKVLNIIVTTLADMKGKIYQMELDYGKKTLTPDLTPEKLKVSLENINKLLGLNLKEHDL